MDNLRIFENSEFGRVRTLLIDGKPYAVGVDVARALGYNKPTDAVLRHCKGTTKHGIPTAGGIQQMLCIPEGDIYRLIIHSELPSAERFERWVFDEVLPTIRQTGSYIAGTKIPQTYPEALRALADEVERREAIEAEKQKLLPKAESYDSLMSTDGLFSMGNAAKILNYQGAGPQNIFKVLVIENVFFKVGSRYSVYQEYLRRAYFREKATTFARGDQIEAYKQIFVTPKGLDWLDKLLAERGYQKNTRKEELA